MLKSYVLTALRTISKRKGFSFLKLVVIANVVAVPLVWLLMDQWLSTFAFRIDIGVWIFAVAALLTAFIARVTVSYHSISTALTNPVKALRYE